MSDRYPGGFLTNAAPTVSTSSATGIWTPEQQLGYQAQGQWPSPPAGPLQVNRSLRFNNADSTYLNRTPGSAGNRRTWTYSTWLKPTKIPNSSGNSCRILSVGASGTAFTEIYWLASTALDILFYDGATSGRLTTTQVFRDPGAWAHMVISVDTTQATSSNRIKLYINGEQVTAFDTATYPSQNYQTYVNTTNAHYIGAYFDQQFDYNYDGYYANIDFVDGQALDPSYFGQTNATTGVWEPIQTVGYLTYGTNGFHLDFSDNSSTTTLGYDTSGNSNNWTANNFSVTAGAGNDSLVDTPTQYGTDTGAGGEVGGNYCTLNPLLLGNSSAISDGNLKLSNPSGNAWNSAFATFIIPTTGKWYWEGTPGASAANMIFGITKSDGNLSGSVSTYPTNTLESYTYYGANGYKYYGPGNVSAAYGDTYTTNDVVGIAFDADSGKLWWSKNGTWQASGDPAAGTNEAFSGLTDQYIPCVGQYDSGASSYVNFGQRPFAYTAPSGFKALCTTNLPAPDVVQGDTAFNTVLWTGDGSSTRSITGVGFQPDFTWFKSRSQAYRNQLYDAVRGAGSAHNLCSDATNSEPYEASLYGYLSSFDSDGFSVGTGSYGNQWSNENAVTYVSWNWKANGSGSSNTDGSITSTVSLNSTAGISIVTYTGNGTVGATVGHGLGATPGIVIIKNRSSATNWPVKALPYMSGGDRLELNNTDAVQTESAGTGSLWNATNPNSTVITLGNQSMTNANASNYVAYCFAPVEGFSAMGSYVGNGSNDGPFVYTGFRPAFVMVRGVAASRGWNIFDDKRDPYNLVDNILQANDYLAEFTYVLGDFVSNGFKHRYSGVGANGSGETYIYMAFAENPFKYALAR